ncbi:MAG: hypothetical protein A2W17_03070 [Planctomycetes bacterium RBG_16_41_13]|nr:MAG: hypothetical protein A2W17_03070 [Planctomycetes bacterium RBG_16_41_13]
MSSLIAMKICCQDLQIIGGENIGKYKYGKYRVNIGTLPILFHQINQEIWEVSLYSILYRLTFNVWRYMLQYD